MLTSYYIGMMLFRIKKMIMPWVENSIENIIIPTTGDAETCPVLKIIKSCRG